MGQGADSRQARKEAREANCDRGERAAEMLIAYDLPDEGECAVIDALSDIRHLCRFNRWDFEKLLTTSADHFNAEIEEE